MRWTPTSPSRRPAFPDNQRTVFKGHLFVGDVLLSDSGMRDPSADADDRFQPGPRAAGPVPPQGRADRLPGSGAPAQRRCASESRNCAPKASAIAIVDAVWAMTTCCAWALPQRTCRSSPRVRASRSACHPTSGIAAFGCLGCAAAPPAGCRRSCPAVARWPPTGRCRPSWQRPRRPSRSIRCVLPQAKTWSAAGPGLGGRRCWPQGPCWSTRRRKPKPFKAVQGRLGAQQAGAWSSGPLPRSRGAWSSWACGNWWWPAARLRAPACKRLRSTSCRSARRSTRACPGAWAGRRRGRAGLHMALKSGNFGADDFFAQSLYDAAHERDRRPARRSAASASSLFDRGYAHATAGNISVRLDDGFLITPTDACLGFLDPASWRDSTRKADADRRRRPARRWHCTRASTRPQRGSTPAPAASSIPTALTASPSVCDAPSSRAAAADHALLRDEGRSRASGRLPAPGRARQRPRKWRKLIAHYGEQGRPIRAVMLQRLGPNVWHDTPGSGDGGAGRTGRDRAADAARRPAPGPAADRTQIDELRRTFGARW